MKKRWLLLCLLLFLVVGCGKTDKNEKKELKCSYDLSGEYKIYENFESDQITYNLNNLDYCLLDFDGDDSLDLVVDGPDGYKIFRIKDGKVDNYGYTNSLDDIEELRVYNGQLAGIISDEAKEKDEKLKNYDIIVFVYNKKMDSVLNNGKEGKNFTKKKFKDESSKLGLKKVSNSSNDNKESNSKENEIGLIYNTMYIDACENELKNESNQCISNKSIEEQIKPFEVESDFGSKYTSSGSIPYFIFKDEKNVDFNSCFGEGCVLSKATYKISKKDGKNIITITTKDDDGEYNYEFEKKGKKLICTDDMGIWLTTNEFIPYEK